MPTSAENLFKKIAYIEADIEIQKQILFSIPVEQHDEIENVLKKIVTAKKDIETIHLELEKNHPEQFGLLFRIEKSVAEFKNIVSQGNITVISNKAEDNNCSIICNDGRKIDCLVKAHDDHGDWIIISEEGHLIRIPAGEVR